MASIPLQSGNDVIARLPWDYSLASSQPEIAKHYSVIVSLTLVLEGKYITMRIYHSLWIGLQHIITHGLVKCLYN